jgi:hypothetical protein
MRGWTVLNSRAARRAPRSVQWQVPALMVRTESRQKSLLSQTLTTSMQARLAELAAASRSTLLSSILATGAPGWLVFVSLRSSALPAVALSFSINVSCSCCSCSWQSFPRPMRQSLPPRSPSSHHCLRHPTLAQLLFLSRPLSITHRSPRQRDPAVVAAATATHWPRNDTSRAKMNRRLLPLHPPPNPHQHQRHPPACPPPRSSSRTARFSGRASTSATSRCTLPMSAPTTRGSPPPILTAPRPRSTCRFGAPRRARIS